jgi:hypothetical protein
MASFDLVALFFFALAVAAATVQPSDARPQALLKPDCVDQHGGQAPHTSPTTPVALPGISPPAAAQPTECLTPLMGMMTCMDYLTNLTVLTPPSAYCDGLKSVIEDAPICLCHGMNGDMNSFMPKPIDRSPAALCCRCKPSSPATVSSVFTTNLFLTVTIR